MMFRNNNNDDGAQGILNYHTIKPDLSEQDAAAESMTNHIGKPLIPLPQPIPKRATKSHAKYSAQPYPRATTVAPNLSQFPSQRPKKSQQITGSSMNVDRSSSGPQKTNCNWMPLHGFKNVSLETGELIVRDEDEQPCYLISMRGFIKFNEDAYFPLSNFQVHPQLHKVILMGRPSDGASVRSAYLNCSLPTSNSGVSSSSLRYSPLLKLTFPFREEIVIRVSCGYLVLQIHGDGFRLNLDSLSIYQDPSVAQEPGRKRTHEIVPVHLASSTESEHLIFSSELASSVAAPLLSLPLTSRYVCQNRVVLTGNNSIQLELDRFELQRLAFTTGAQGKSETYNNQHQSGSVAAVSKNTAVRQPIMAEKNASIRSKRSVRRRLARDAHVETKLPSGKCALLIKSNPRSYYRKMI